MVRVVWSHWTSILYVYTVFIMSLVLSRKLNHRNIELHDSTRGEAVGVLKRSGEYGYVPWLGFIDRSKAPRTGRPPRMARLRFAVSGETQSRPSAPGPNSQRFQGSRGIAWAAR